MWAYEDLIRQYDSSQRFQTMTDFPPAGFTLILYNIFVVIL